MSQNHDYHHWPFLTPEEFELACAFFDQKYVRAKLGRTRQVFKLRSRRTATTGTTYIEILRLLSPPADDNDLSLVLEKLGRVSTNLTSGSDLEMDAEDEEEDKEALQPSIKTSLEAQSSDSPPPYSLYSHQPYVAYEIHLHHTYSVPTLWFMLHDLPMAEPAFDLDAVYRYLVPESYKSRLREIGVIGGISAAPHPITDIPTFFIHPCQTKEAMENLNCPIQDYLMVWIGLVGGCVGLWVPPEMAEDQDGNE